MIFLYVFVLLKFQKIWFLKHSLPRNQSFELGGWKKSRNVLSIFFSIILFLQISLSNPKYSQFSLVIGFALQKFLIFRYLTTHKECTFNTKWLTFPNFLTSPERTFYAASNYKKYYENSNK